MKISKILSILFITFAFLISGPSFAGAYDSGYTTSESFMPQSLGSRDAIAVVDTSPLFWRYSTDENLTLNPKALPRLSAGLYMRGSTFPTIDANKQRLLVGDAMTPFRKPLEIPF